MLSETILQVFGKARAGVRSCQDRTGRTKETRSLEELKCVKADSSAVTGCLGRSRFLLIPEGNGKSDVEGAGQYEQIREIKNAGSYRADTDTEEIYHSAIVYKAVEEIAGAACQDERSRCTLPDGAGIACKHVGGYRNKQYRNPGAQKPEAEAFGQGVEVTEKATVIFDILKTNTIEQQADRGISGKRLLRERFCDLIGADCGKKGEQQPGDAPDSQHASIVYQSSVFP